MPLSGIDACKRALRVTRAQFQRGVGDLREVIRKRSKGVKKTRGQLRKLEAKVKELGGALSEEVSDGSSVLYDTSSDSDSDMGSDDAKEEPSSASDKASAAGMPKAKGVPTPKAKARVKESQAPSSGRRSKQSFPEVPPGETLRYTRANPTPKASGTLVSPKGTPGVVRLASNLDGVFLALVRSTTRTVPGRFAAKPRRSSRKAISCMAHDTPLVGCDSNSPPAASAPHPTIQYVLCQVHGESAEARPVL